MKMLRSVGWAVLSAAALLAQPPASSPASAEPGTRAAEWEQLRRQKAQNLGVYQPKRLEHILYRLQEDNLIEKLRQPWWHGFAPRFGGGRTGSGFMMGLGFTKSNLAENIDVRLDALISFRAYEKFQFQIGAPRLFGNRMFVDFTSLYTNWPQERYFGLGPKTRERDRVNFRHEQVDHSARIGFRPFRSLSFGLRGGWMQVNTGPGTDERYPSIEQRFTAANTPALDRQPDFYHLGPFAQIDYRDNPRHPHSGGNYLFDAAWFGDRDFARYSFRRFDVELQQYLPLFNARRVIALRAKTTLTDTGPGQQIPFFLQPTVGGSEDLRGFREYRFRDKNLLVFNAEYRWTVFTAMDMALFADAGRVFSRRREFGLDTLEGSLGFGFRFNTRRGVFLRADFGFSREGQRVFIKMGHVF